MGPLSRGSRYAGAPMRRWTICYSRLSNTTELIRVLLADDLFGADETSKWHLARHQADDPL